MLMLFAALQAAVKQLPGTGFGHHYSEYLFGSRPDLGRWEPTFAMPEAMEAWGPEMAVNTAKFFRPGHGHPGQGICAWNYEQAVALFPGCPCISCLWQAMVRQGHVNFLEKEIAFQQDTLANVPDFIIPEHLPDWQASVLARINALRNKLEEVNRQLANEFQAPMHGRAIYSYPRLNHLGMLGNWPDSAVLAAGEHVSSPCSPAPTVSPMQPWSLSPPQDGLQDDI